MNKRILELMRSRSKRSTAKPPTESPLSPMTMVLPDDGEPYTPVGVRGLVAATSKLLAVNRGLTPTDDRDSMAFKHVMPTDKLIAERIRLDTGGMRRKLIRQMSVRRTLAPVVSGAFEKDVLGHLVDSPLSSPLEEINPMSLVSNARRMTAMGPGGIGSEQAITPAMQMVHSSQFGFVSALEGPESSRSGIDVRLANGVQIGSNGRLYQRFKDARTGKMVWLSPADLHGKVVGLPE